MGYFVYLILFYQCLSLIFSILTVYYTTVIIFQLRPSTKKLQMAPNMKLFFVYAFIAGSLGIFYYGYCVVLWRADTVIYNAQLLYILGILPFTLVYINTIIEGFLCIDRCIFVLFPIKYKFKYQLICMFASMITSSGAIFMYFYSYAEYFPLEAATTCIYFSCVVKSLPILVTMRSYLAGFSLGVSAFLAILLKFKFKSSSSQIKKMNKAILMGIIFTMFNEVMPQIVTRVYQGATNLRLSDYVGPFGVLFSTFSVCISSGIYYSVYQKTSSKTNISNQLFS